MSSSPLLATKLYIPQSRATLVHRARLIERLGDSMSRALTLVSAPAGFGKSTLVGDWIRHAHPDAAWVSLDENDNDMARFFGYVIATLQTIDSTVGVATLASIQAQPAQFPAIENALTVLLNEVAQHSVPFVLVLDDYHVIHSQPIHNAVAFLLEHLPPQMHLILITRADPPFTVARLRVRNQLVELRAADLRFTPGEAAAFLNDVMHSNVTAQQVGLLAERTEGWIAGLQLAALSIQGREDVPGFVDAFAGSNRLVLNYLMEEVLQRQHTQVQEFLLQTSVLSRLDATLCDAVTLQADSRKMLDHLEQSNLFLIPLDDSGRWYRYHHLFADTLRARLEQSRADLIPALHQRASLWFEQHEYPNEAVTHALAAKDYTRAVQLIETFDRSMYARNDLPTLVEWIQALPALIVQSRPKLALSCAWALLATSHAEETERYLLGIERSVGTNADALLTSEAVVLRPDIRATLCEVTIIRCSLTMTRLSYPEKLRRLQNILPHLTDEAPSIYNTPAALRPVARFNMALAHEYSGESAKASDAFRHAVALAREQGNMHIVSLSISHLAQLQVVQGQLRDAAKTYREALQATGGLSSPLYGLAHAGLGTVLYEWDDLDRASDEFRKAIDLGKVWSNWETLLPSYVGIAQVLSARGDCDGALALVDELGELVRRFDTPSMQPAINACYAEINTRCKKVQAAVRWAEAFPLPVESIEYDREEERILLARVLMGGGRAKDALELLERLLPGARSGSRTQRVIRILALQSLALHELAQDVQADQVLRQALALAEPEGYVRTFVDCGTEMQQLLQKVDIDYARKLAAAFPSARVQEKLRGKSPSLPPSVGLSPSGPVLSERERQVLQLIIDGWSNQEIANKLVISIRTVKKHVENIYGKLDVKSRTQAVAKARELNIL